MNMKLTPILALMISIGLPVTEAFAEESINIDPMEPLASWVTPFTDPFEYLYNIERYEGVGLADLPNGKYYRDDTPDLSDFILDHGTIYQVNTKTWNPHDDWFTKDVDTKTLSITDQRWNIVWKEEGSPSGQNWHYPTEKSTFLYIDCMSALTDGNGAPINLEMEDVSHVIIDNIHITHDIKGSRIPATNAPIPYKTISVNNCESVSITNSTFKGPVLDTHIEVKNTNHIYIDNIEIAGTYDFNTGEYYLGGGISIGGGDKNRRIGVCDNIWGNCDCEDPHLRKPNECSCDDISNNPNCVDRGTYSTIITNSYIHDFTRPSDYALTKESNPNLDAVAIRSPGTGIFFNNYIENYGNPDFKHISGLDIGHSRGDNIGRGDPDENGTYWYHTFKIERNIFDNVNHNKLAGKYGVDQGNQLLFSNNVYYDTKWGAYFCNTEVVFAFESYYFTQNDEMNSRLYPLLKYGGCPREVLMTEQQKIDENGQPMINEETGEPVMELVRVLDENGEPILDPNQNHDAHLMDIKRYNTHYYFMEEDEEKLVRVRPNSFTNFNGALFDNYKFLDEDGNLDRLARPQELIVADYNRYSFNVGLDYYDSSVYDPTDDCLAPDYDVNYTSCLVEPSIWILGVPIKTVSNGFARPSNYNELTQEEQDEIDQALNAAFVLYQGDFQEEFNVEAYFSRPAGYLTALEAYQWLGQEEQSSFSEGTSSTIGESIECTKPMLVAKERYPSLASLEFDSQVCGHLKTAGSQMPLINDGFRYSITLSEADKYQLFRRDFYGKPRHLLVSVGAFQ